MPLRVRERAPLRLHADLLTPSGRHYRWGPDEHKPENVPSGLTLSSTMPGGFEQASGVLARQPARDYNDLDELSTLTIMGAGGEIAWQGRLESSPRVSGDEMSISPGCVGWQAGLDDDKSARMIYVDRDVTAWGDMSLNRKVAIAGGGESIGDFSWSSDAGGLICALPNSPVAGGGTLAEVWYIAPSGVTVATVMYIGSDTSLPAGWEAPKLFDAATDTGAGNTSQAATFDSTLRSIAPANAHRYIFWREYSTGAAPVVTPAKGANRRISVVAVYGNHGLTTRAIDASTPDGLYTSDVVAHAVGKWAPKLAFTTGPGGTIAQSAFIIPHLVFRDLTTASEIVRQSTRFELQDWAVWEGPTFYMNDRGARGSTWRARVGPAKLSEAGPQVDRLWESIVVQYQDPGGVTRTVGPVGSGCDTEDASLKDSDPLNPANELGLTRRDLLVMGTSTAAGAIAVGARFLALTKLLDSAGSAELVGHVEDDHGVLWPAWKVRGGDSIVFVDAADPSARRIVRAEYTDTDKTCHVDLDQPPDALQALLERLDVVLVPLGLG